MRNLNVGYPGRKPMNVKESLREVVDSLPEERLRQLLDYAAFLQMQEERADWRRFGRAQLNRAYGPHEPEYTLADIKPERHP